MRFLAFNYPIVFMTFNDVFEERKAEIKYLQISFISLNEILLLLVIFKLYPY